VQSELIVTPGDIQFNACYVAEQEGDVVGFYLIADDSLERMFVSPDRMRQGIGRMLFNHAAVRLGPQTLRIVSDPNAAPFYQRMGARYKGQENSTLVRGRSLPVYEYRRTLGKPNPGA
jgi:GNAT superfamily N-acetyltransferase